MRNYYSPLPGREDFIINNYQGSNPNPVDTITYEYDSFEIKEDRHQCHLVKNDQTV